MIDLDILKESDAAAVPAILSIAREREGRRRERTLTEHDVLVFLATVRRYPESKVRVYAQRGAFVANKYRFRAPITALEYWPASEEQPAGACVSETDAKRSGGRGPWVTVNGRKEI